MKRTIISILIVLALCGCKGHGDATTDSSRLEYSAQINEVEVMTLHRQGFHTQLLSNGKLSAAQKSSLYFSEDGIITKINVHNGSAVTKGSVIATLDSQEQQSALESAKINLDKARLDFLDVIAGLGYSVSDTASVPEDVLSLAEIRSGYSSAQNAFRKAERALKGTVITAPFSGKAADVKLKPWDKCGSDPFCTLINDSSFDVTFTVLESEYSSIEKGQTVRVSLFGQAGKETVGKITSINPVIDENGQIDVTATISGGRGELDGMNVKIIAEKVIAQQYVVPKKAVVIRDNLEVLFRYHDGKAEWVYVKTTGANGEEYAIVANEERGAELHDGDRIIVSGNLNLADGSEVVLKR